MPTHQFKRLAAGGDPVDRTAETSSGATPNGNSRWSKVLTGMAYAAVIGALVATPLLMAEPASATPTRPHLATTYYITTSSTTTAYNEGCSRGTTDASNNANTEVLLDFGGQLSDDSGAKSVFDTSSLSNSQIEAVGVAFAHGYYHCTGSNLSVVLHLGIGTNNSAYNVSTAGGETWGSVVNSISSTVSSDGYSSQVTIEGADDMEPSFDTYSNTLAWAQGFSTRFSGIYVNYGSADGCSQTSSADNGCNNGWTTYRVYEVSYGLPPAQTAPEIYYTSQSNQWYEISLYGAQTHSEVYYQGPLDEHPMDSSTFTYTDAWDTFANKLDSNTATSQTMPYDLEIQEQ